MADHDGKAQSESDMITWTRILAWRLAQALSKLYPDVKLGLGSADRAGFHYDFDLGAKRLKPTDLATIKARMVELLNDDSYRPTTTSVSLKDALKLFEQQPYKIEVLKNLESLIQAGHFPGQHHFVGLSQTNQIDLDNLAVSGDDDGFVDLFGARPATGTFEGLFELNDLSGAYWLGQSDRIQMQRISGSVWSDAQSQKSHQAHQAAVVAGDHRRLGADLGLFMHSEVIGAGLPILLKDGATIRRLIEKFVIDIQVEAGYEHVVSPDISQLELYQQSGHHSYYSDSMYQPITIDQRQFMLRPMTCPHHFQIYKRRRHSYKELPVRLAEIAKLYRYEKSGQLTGLLRVRCFTLTDAHIICRPDQAATEVSRGLDLIEKTVAAFGFDKQKDYYFRLSLGDLTNSNKYFPDPQAWQLAEDCLRQVLKDRGQPFVEAVDEAAFYGPKIDIQMKDIKGKEETAFTIQYDFVMPKRFDLNYDDQNNQPAEAVVIHRSTIGSIERFLAFLIEYYQGRFPFWLAPTQVRLLTTASQPELVDFSRQLVSQAWHQPSQLRFELDDSDDSLAKKVQKARQQLVAAWIVIGPKEVDSGQLSLQVRPDLAGPSLVNPVPAQSLAELLAWLNQAGLNHHWQLNQPLSE